MQGCPVAIDAGGPASHPYDAGAALGFETIGGVHVIEAAAHRFPDNTAVDDGKIRLTYRDFLDRSYGAAKRILEMTAPDAVVCSLIGNSAAAPVIVTACAIAGRVLVPIDASHPRERQAAIFAESGAQLVTLAGGEAVDDSVIPPALQRLVVDPIAQTGAARPPYYYDPGRPLFVSFTSGSTGRPKGILSGSHYGGSAIRHVIDMFHLNHADVILGLSSLSTGGSRDAFAALGVGAKVRILPLRTGGVAEALRVLDSDRVSILSFIPSALRKMLAIEGAERAFRHLRVLDLHGERILASDIALFRAKLPPTCHISVTMGSVETGAVFSWFVRDQQIDGPVVPVGYIMPGRSIALLDDDGSPVAHGEVGELVVRGRMAIGGWQSGAKIGGPFLPDPADPASSIYAMGDLVRQRPDGLFEYVGRKDRKTKVRGLWADLGEVEAVLRSIGGVADAVLITTSDAAGAERLTAFVVLTPGSPSPSVATIRTAVAQQTAEQMVPAEIRFLDGIPRLANFKPDLMSLRAMSRLHHG
jgi:acyl-coenzyme A synthetase/AMP-(fatty) acid ligase